MINSEMTSQVSGRMNEIKVGLHLHTRETIEDVISEQALPTIRETSGEVVSGARTNNHLISSARHRSPEVNYPKRIWGNIPKVNRDVSYQN